MFLRAVYAEAAGDVAARSTNFEWGATARSQIFQARHDSARVRKSGRALLGMQRRAELLSVGLAFFLLCFLEHRARLRQQSLNKWLNKGNETFLAEKTYCPSSCTFQLVADEASGPLLDQHDSQLLKVFVTRGSSVFFERKMGSGAIAIDAAGDHLMFFKTVQLCHQLIDLRDFFGR